MGRILSILLPFIVLAGLLASPVLDFIPIVKVVKHFVFDHEETNGEIDFQKVTRTFKVMNLVCQESLVHPSQTWFDGCTLAMRNYVDETNAFGRAGGDAKKLSEMNLAYIKLYNESAKIYGHPELKVKKVE